MVYIHSWQEFQKAAEELYAKEPFKTRYCVKWRSSDGKGKLVLKITDDVQCIKYKTHSSVFLNRFEALNLSLMEKMQNVTTSETQDVDMADTTQAGGRKAGPANQAQDTQPSNQPTNSSTPAAGGSVAAGGAKKKKKGKKK